MAQQALAGRHTSAGFTTRRPKAIDASLRPRLVVCSLSLERQGPYHDELRQTAKYISRRGFGILVSRICSHTPCYRRRIGDVALIPDPGCWFEQASDESNMTTGKRLDSVGEYLSALK
jgi:hypothetical protein